MAADSLRLVALLLFLSLWARAEPVTYPYLRNLQPESVDLYWVDTDPAKIEVEWQGRKTTSTSRPAPELDFHPEEKRLFTEKAAAPKRYLHQAHLDGLKRQERVSYKVHFPDGDFEEEFKTLPAPDRTVRLIAYADSETEPESTGKPTKWETPEAPKRRYLVDQTTGYAANLAAIRERDPDAILIAGDLAESGGEQRDWDEFWKHNKTVAGAVPLLPAPGNHEYYAGPKCGKYETESSRWAINKYRAYFGKAPFYRRDIGPVALFSIDSVDSLPHRSATDSNFYLQAAGDFAPGYYPGSPQVKWLEKELAEAQKAGKFIAVEFHHCPYSSGPHGFEPGEGEGKDRQSGRPLRTLTPLFLKYGVEVLINGHDEMLERSVVEGKETMPDGKTRPTELLVYDVGIGGDGLRGPELGNPYRKFLVTDNVSEVWEDGVLVAGGRHYGHLEIDVTPTSGGWRATLTPAYLFPIKSEAGWRFERRVYPDVITLKSK